MFPISSDRFLLSRDVMLERFSLSSRVCPYVRLYVTSLYCTKMAKHIITQTMPTIAQGF